MAVKLLNQRYRVGPLLGQGEHGSVYRADDDLSGEPCCIKLLGNSSELALSEFQALATLNHAGVVAVRELAQVVSGPSEFPMGAYFLCSDYVAGVDLAESAAAAKDPNDWFARNVSAIASALAHCHGLGILHCDLKPANLLVGERGPVLIDFGLAHGASARGTPSFMAPEALAGHPEPRSDLFSLGATLFFCGAGRPPYAGDRGARLSQMFAASAPRSADHTPFHSRFCDLIDSLLSPDPERRPSSAAAVIDDVHRFAGELGIRTTTSAFQGLRAPALVGRTEALAAAKRAIEGAPRVVALVGSPGSGHRAVLTQVQRRLQLEAVARSEPVGVVFGTIDQLARVYGVAPASGDEQAASRFCDDFLGALARACHGRTCVMLDSAGDPRCESLIRAALVDPRIGDLLTLIVAVAEDLRLSSHPRLAKVELLPVGRDELTQLATEMVGVAPSKDVVNALLEGTGGSPALAVRAIRACVDSLGRLDAKGLREILSGADAQSRRRSIAKAQVGALDPVARSVLMALAAASSALSVPLLAAICELGVPETRVGLATLRARGLAAEVDGQYRARAMDAQAILGALSRRESRQLFLAILRSTEAESCPARLRLRYLVGADKARDAVSLCLEATAEFLARGAHSSGDALATRLAALCRTKKLATGLPELAQAQCALAAADYARAIALAKKAASFADSARGAALTLAEATRKAGAAGEALGVLEGLVSEHDEDPEIRGLWAKALASAGQYADALRVVGAEPEGPAALEAAGLAQLYTGKPALARQLFSDLLGQVTQPGPRARAFGLRGMVAHSQGEFISAAADYERALDLARSACDYHGAVVFAANSASLLFERGDYSRGLRGLERAHADLLRIGDVAARAGVHYNRGLFLLAVGEQQAAESAADSALACAEEHESHEFAAYARVLLGDCAVRKGDPESALLRFAEAAKDAAARGLSKAEAVAQRRAAELNASLGRAVALGEQASDGDFDAHALTRSRIALATGENGDPTALLGVMERNLACGRRVPAWRAGALAARLLARSGDSARARAAASSARRALDEVLESCESLHQSGISAEPEVQALLALERQLGVESQVGPDLAGMRRLLSLSRRLNSELRLAPLLDEVMDAAIELSRGERGFLLLAGPEGLKMEVARNLTQEASDEAAISRSIAERAAQRGEVVLSVDAVFDQRFDESVSVAAMQLRSVLAVPLRSKGTIIGTLYVDHRYRRGAFDEVAVEYLRELADIAAVAIANARLAEAVAARQREVDQLNQRLAQEVVVKDAELEVVRAQLAAGRSGLRFDYDAIIGRSRAMTGMLAMLDRAVDTSLPVVIHGESGTGKELVARALHDHGPRREGAFVAINCGAVPAELLESELFGHVRGSFSGAERDRRGLFELADGGTLFLDEIADTSLAMQAKLLRVLQEGEFRRVGDEELRHSDARIVAASNQDLESLVKGGRFREDLYFRLHVLRVSVPPLRDRVEDLKALCQHFLRDSGRSITDGALARLARYSWPGNVRELENELARVSAMGHGAIDEGELSPRLLLDPEAAVEGLAIRPQVEKLERSLIEQAMERTGGNQSQAAKLLGLSRYGLQKKLKRLEEA